VHSAFGLYGVIACSVTRRTREIGVRMALVARRSPIHRMVLGDASRLTPIGIAGTSGNKQLIAGLN